MAQVECGQSKTCFLSSVWPMPWLPICPSLHLPTRTVSVERGGRSPQCHCYIYGSGPWPMPKHFLQMGTSRVYMPLFQFHFYKTHKLLQFVSSSYIGCPLLADNYCMLSIEMPESLVGLWASIFSPELHYGLMPMNALAFPMSWVAGLFDKLISQWNYGSYLQSISGSLVSLAD